MHAGRIFTLYEIRQLRELKKTGSQKTSEEQETVLDNSIRRERDISVLLLTIPLPNSSAAVQRIFVQDRRK